VLEGEVDDVGVWENDMVDEGVKVGLVVKE
jgi:hypothetical protein